MDTDHKPSTVAEELFLASKKLKERDEQIKRLREALEEIAEVIRAMIREGGE